ncbi:hypothetical protein ACH4VT_33465 [Streptomyces lydicus]|uniref:hypothetical protein n=1 Tax=Streptomyces lydicus TaxID=47763 RepID=UPI0037A6DB88
MHERARRRRLPDTIERYAVSHDHAIRSMLVEIVLHAVSTIQDAAVLTVSNHARRLPAALASALVALCLSGCATDSPPKHSERLQKAAGLPTFEIDTTAGLWEKTSKVEGYVGKEDKFEGKVKPLDNGLRRISLTGTDLANYLRHLDYHAHGGAGGGAPWSRYREAESIRMYDEISHKLDSVTHRPSQGDPPLRIVVDDAFLDAKHK